MLVTPTEALDADELWARAEAAFAAGDAAAAVADLELVAALDGEGDLSARARLRAAEMADLTGDLAGATRQLERLLRRHPEAPVAREALLRTIRLHAHQEHWSRAGALADRLRRSHPDLGAVERLVAHGAKALELVAVAELDGAGREIERGLLIVDELGLDRAGPISRDVAALHFASGELRRAQAEAIRFVPAPSDFVGALERRCELLLDAQRAYSTTMRAYDAHWSAMAGFRTGELYQSLHRDLMAVPPPVAADSTARRDLFAAAMRLRYSVLLEKALTMMDHTLAMAERTGEESPWIARASAARAALATARAQEEAALAALPYTRDELASVLAERSRAGQGRAREAPGGEGSLYYK